MHKANILLELIYDIIIIEYPNTKEYIQQRLYGKCDREGIPIDNVILYFLAILEAKTFLQTKHVI